VRHRLKPPAVLVYHGVGEVDPDGDPARLVAGRRTLESHMDWLRRRGYRFFPAGELARRAEEAGPPARTAVLTFDDGLLDGLTTVGPLLRDRGLPATFFVCPGLLGGQHELIAGAPGRLLTAEQVRELAAQGFELGAHSMTHPDLRGLDDGALRTEVRGSKEAVEDLTGRPCRTFAYPYGLFDERVEHAVAAAGYEIAFAWGPGPWRRLAAPRLPAPTRYGPRRLAAKLLVSRLQGARAPERANI
jgi:peptidoglycan/xylan/chitin deacetylase (PgdA/CDA1 family)